MSGNVVLHNAQYEIIDQDPHFERVVRFFRPSDWASLAAFTASGPAFLGAISYFTSKGKKIHVPGTFFRLSLALGFTAGFLNQYGITVLRFQGLNENAREVAKDRFEIKQRLAQGKTAYGHDESSMPAWIRSLAARNSTYSSLYLSAFPWFNLVNHEHHGIDLNKYYETRPGEESWGFNLKR